MVWGGSDNALNTGYVAINGIRVLNTNSGDYIGFNLVQLDVSSCSSTNILHFDTFGFTAEADAMATYINSLPLYTVLIGITSDEASFRLTQNAKNVFNAIRTSMDSLQFRGKGYFMAQIGQPSTSVSQLGSIGGNNLKIYANVTGISKSILPQMFIRLPIAVHC